MSDDEERDDLADKISFAIGRRVRMQRIRRGLTGKQLGDLINLNSDQIARYERGARRLTVGRLFLIARALGVPIGYFFNDIAADARVKMMPLKSDHEESAKAHDLVLHLARLATQLDSAYSRALLLSLLEQLPGGHAVARAQEPVKTRIRVRQTAKNGDAPP